MLAVFLMFGSNLSAMAQDKEEKARKEAIEKAEKRQKEDKEHVEKEMKVRKEFLEKEMRAAMQEKEFTLQEMEIHLDELTDHMSEMEVYFKDGGSMVIPSPPEKNVVFMSDEWMPFGQGSQTQLTLRNSFRGGSDSSTGTFDVEEGVKRIRCMISGKVKSGEIKITIKYPGGKTFKDMTINSSAEVTFSQTVNIKEGKEASKYVGSWEYSIEAAKAEGNYMMQISTF